MPYVKTTMHLLKHSFQEEPDGIVGVVATLRALRPRNRGSIAGRSKTFVSLI